MVDRRREPPDNAEVQSRALRLVRWRERHPRELQRRLAHAGASTEQIEAVEAQLVESGLLNEERFLRQRAERRIRQGYGPRYISADLGMAGGDTATVRDLLDSLQTDWVQVCRETIYRKRVDPTKPIDGKERQDLSRWMMTRGFSAGQVQQALQRLGDEGPDDAET